VPSDNAAAHSKNELSRSYSRLVDEPLGDSHRESDGIDSVEPAVVKTGDTEVKDGCNNVMEEANIFPHDLASSKPVSLLLPRLVLAVHEPCSELQIDPVCCMK
jgi:hypothetical protein